MFLRRLLYILILGLSFAGIAWAAGLLRFPSETGNAPEPAGERRQPKGAYEAAVAENVPLGRSPIDYARFDARLSRLAEQPNMVGLAVGIVENGEITFLKGYGETVHESGEPVTADTVFRWASLSKGVAADMVALLAHQTRLSLFEPVGRYAASLRLPGGNEHKATVADLLSHQLGIFAHAYDSKLEDGEDPRHLRGRLATLNNICSPGQCHAYQNVAYDAASEIVERVTGMSYGEAVHEHFFRPLGMSSASISLEGLTGARSWARPHVGGPRPLGAGDIKPAYYRVPAAGGVNGSIKDLALWMRAQMGEKSEVLPPAVLEAVQSPRADTPRENRRRREVRERLSEARYGLGWRIFDYAGHKVVGHHGGVRGYRSLILFDPDRKTGVVALWNSSTSKPWALQYEVMDMAYGLPFRNWLELGEDAPEPEPDEGEIVNEGP